jgi:hypothetical protein
MKMSRNINPLIIPVSIQINALQVVINNTGQIMFFNKFKFSKLFGLNHECLECAQKNSRNLVPSILAFRSSAFIIKLYG